MFVFFLTSIFENKTMWIPWPGLWRSAIIIAFGVPTSERTSRINGLGFAVYASCCRHNDCYLGRNRNRLTTPMQDLYHEARKPMKYSYIVQFNVASCKTLYSHLVIGPSIISLRATQITKLMGPIWVPSGSCNPQLGPMLAPWILISWNACEENTLVISPKGPVTWKPF